MVLGLSLAHVPSYFADYGHGRHDLDAIDLGRVCTSHAKQLLAHFRPKTKKMNTSFARKGVPVAVYPRRPDNSGTRP